MAKARSAKPSGRAYDAFVSYSHAADGELAPAVQAGLQDLAKPLLSRRALKVFRDQTGLSVNASLWASICSAMDGSEWFVLMASPEAAASEWVGREIERWVATRDPSKILPVVTDGTWIWDGARSDFDWERSTAVHPALRGVFSAEPRHLDLTWAKGEDQLTLRNGRFRDQIAELAAPMHGKSKDELEGEDVRQQHRTRRYVTGAIAGLAVLAATSIAGGSLAVASQRQAVNERERAEEERDRADQRSREAISRRLASLSNGLVGSEFAGADADDTLLGDGGIKGSDRALPYLLAAEAYRKAPTAEAEGALIARASQASRNNVGYRLVGHEPQVVDAAVRADGKAVATVDGTGTVRLFSLDATGDPVVIGGSGDLVAFTGAGSLVVADGATLRWFDASGDEQSEAGLEGDATALAAGDGEGSVVAALADGSVVVVDEGGEATVFADSTGVIAPVTVAMVAGGVLVSDAGGDAVIVGEGGASGVGWQGKGPVTDVSDDGTLAVEVISDLEFGTQPLPIAQVRDTRTGDVAWTFSVYEPYVPQAAMFLPDDRLVVATYGGVDGAPSQLFMGSEDDEGTAVLSVNAELPRTIAVGAGGGGVVVLGGDDELVAAVTLDGGGGFGADVLPSGWVPSMPLSASNDGRVVLIGDDGFGLFDVDGSEVAELGVAGESAVVSPDGRWLVVDDGTVIEVASGDAVAGLDAPRGSFGVVPSWSDDGSRLAYVVDAGSPESDTSPAAQEPSTEVAVVDLERKTVTTVAATDELCRNGCFGGNATISLSPDGDQLVLRGRSTSDSSSESADLVELFGVAETAEAQASVMLAGPGPVAFTADGSAIRVHDGTGVLTLAADDLSIENTAVSDRFDAWEFSPGDERVAINPCSVYFLDLTSWTVTAAVQPPVGFSEAGCEGAPDVEWIDGGSVLLTATSCTLGEECAMQRWDIDPQRLFDQACTLAGRNLTQDEWAQFLPDWPYEKTCEQYGEGGSATDTSTTTPSDPGDQPGTPSTTEPDGFTTTTLSGDGYEGGEGYEEGEDYGDGGGGGGGSGQTAPGYEGGLLDPEIDDLITTWAAGIDSLRYDGECTASETVAPGHVCATVQPGSTDDQVEVHLLLWNGDPYWILTFERGSGGWEMTTADETSGD